MPLLLPSRLSSILASALAAGLALAVVSCSNDTPSHVVMPTPAGPASTPPLSTLRSPFVLGAVRSQPATSAGKCPAGSVALSGGAGQCYRQLGAPVTISSAGVGPVITDALHFQGLYGFWIVLPSTDVAALRAITTTAANGHANLDVSVAGQGWLLPIPGRPFTNGQLEMFLPKIGNSLASRNSQVLKLHRVLLSPS
jgi:hypothetical protein